MQKIVILNNDHVMTHEGVGMIKGDNPTWRALNLRLAPQLTPFNRVTVIGWHRRAYMMSTLAESDMEDQG